MTAERYMELVEIERAAGDFVTMLRDFGGSRLKVQERLVEINADGPYPAAMINAAITELEEALSPEPHIIA